MLLAVYFILNSFPYILESILGVLGRDMTLTGRTDLWADLLKEPINSLVGSGYHTFWLGERAERYWEMYQYRPNQAHNGYLETYLNSGLIGLSLFLIMLISVGRRLKHEFLYGNKNWAAISFCFFIVALLTNWTEAFFNRQSIIWIVMIIAMLNANFKSGYSLGN